MPEVCVAKRLRAFSLCQLSCYPQCDLRSVDASLVYQRKHFTLLLNDPYQLIATIGSKQSFLISLLFDEGDYVVDSIAHRFHFALDGDAVFLHKYTVQMGKRHQ
jgi:hypothetical protein